MEIGDSAMLTPSQLYRFELIRSSAVGTARPDGVLEVGEGWDSLQSQLSKAVLHFREGTLNEQFTTIRWIERVLAERPDFLDAYLVLGCCYTDVQQPAKALATLSKGVALATDLIPEGFSGEIPWFYTANRWYLRLLYRTAMCTLFEHSPAEAYSLAQRLLAADPADPLGARYILLVSAAFQGLPLQGLAANMVALQPTLRDGAGELVTAMCYLVQQRYVEASAHFLSMMQTSPELLAVIRDRGAVRLEEPNGYFTTYPAKTTWRYLLRIAFARHPKLREGLLRLARNPILTTEAAMQSARWAGHWGEREATALEREMRREPVTTHRLDTQHNRADMAARELEHAYRGEDAAPHPYLDSAACRSVTRTFTELFPEQASACAEGLGIENLDFMLETNALGAFTESGAFLLPTSDTK